MQNHLQLSRDETHLLDTILTSLSERAKHQSYLNYLFQK
jgi:hypothetical protein